MFFLFEAPMSPHLTSGKGTPCVAVITKASEWKKEISQIAEYLQRLRADAAVLTEEG